MIAGLLLLCCVAAAYAGFTLEQGIPHFNTKPYFLAADATNATAVEGQSAYLHCRVAQLGDKKVSWIRGRDLHVLTSGVHTFASDQRFIALHQDRSENWTLHIRFSQSRDSGEYQCQVNTDPRISMSFYLHVIEAATMMEGPSQHYVKAGSDIRLSCKTSVVSQPPGLLYWYRDTEILQGGGRVRIHTVLEDHSRSDLVVEAATVQDSGNYTCWPTKFQPASVMVHVIPEVKAAAKSQSSGSSGTTTAVTTQPSLTTTSAAATRLAPPTTLGLLTCCLPLPLSLPLPLLLPLPLPLLAWLCVFNQLTLLMWPAR